MALTAKAIVSRKLASQINKFTQEMPVRLQTSFIKRLSYLHDTPRVKELVDLWFNRDGWLGKKLLDGSYDGQDLVKIRLLSAAAEAQLLNLIELKHKLDENFLTRENQYFVELSHLIRFLTYQEHNFKKAFELLLVFSKNEKEGEKNNSILELLTSLFRLYSSQTLASLDLKKEVLSELKKKEGYQSILLACISTALNFHGSGCFIVDHDENGRSFDYGYYPKTYDEVWSWVEFLLGIMDELDAQGVVQVRNIFTDHLKAIIWTCGSTNPVKDYLERFSKRSRFFKAHSEILNIIQWNSDVLEEKAPSLLKEIKMLENNLRPSKENIKELIECYVLVSDIDLYRMNKNSNDKYAIKIPEFNCYEDLMSFIGEQVQDIDVLTENFYSLIHASNRGLNKSYLVDLGVKAAHSFSDVRQCIIALESIDIDKSLLHSEFLLGISKFFKQSNEQDYRALVVFLAGNQKFRNFADVIIFQGCQVDADFLFLSGLLKDKILHSSHSLGLAWSKRHKKITNSQFECLMDVFVEISCKEVVRFELGQEYFFRKKVANKYKNILSLYVYDSVSGIM